MRKFLFLLSLILVVFSLAIGQAEARKNDDKISATLRAVIEQKKDYLANPMSEKFKALKERGLQEARYQIVFLHTKEKLTDKQLEFLVDLKVEVLGDFWMPPFGMHKTGYIVARVPTGKIRRLAKKKWVVRLETAEQGLTPQNDFAAESINAIPVWEKGFNGADVKIAVLDSGLDTSHADIPKPIASKDYSKYPYLDDTIENLITAHGTHVVASALGRGILSGGKYRGIAWGADLIFLKIGNDYDSNANPPAMAAAIKAAVDKYHADIISISYGGFDPYKDGTDETCQAVDYAKSKGVIVFVAAGNEAARQKHYSGTVGSFSETDFIKIDVAGYISMDMNWFDGVGVSNDLHIKLYDADKQEISVSTFRGAESARGTELEVLSAFVPAEVYYVKVENNSNSDQFFHIYSLTPLVTFANADPNYTVMSPALADGAIAIASYNTRPSWTNYLGDLYDFEWFGGKTGEISSFSSRGPRIDGAEKPQLAAPGAWLISARDKILALGGADYIIIDNDGINDGKGPADYATSVGTSMSCPVAAGGAASLMQANPAFKGNPDALIALLQETASGGGKWNGVWGYGLINLSAALNAIPPTPTPTPTGTSIPTPIPIPTNTQTPEPIPSITPSPPTPIPSPTGTSSPVPTPTGTSIPTPVPSPEITPVIPTPLPTPKETPTPEPLPTPTPIVGGGGGGGDEPFTEGFEVQSTNPKDGAADVEIDVTIIKATYNQFINGDKLMLDENGSGIEFRVEGTEDNLTVKVKADFKNLMITPCEPLKPGTVYTLRIFSRGIKAANNAGTQMNNDFTMKFTTATVNE